MKKHLPDISLVQHLPIAILLVDDQLNLNFYNSAAEKLLGLSNKKNISKILSANNRKKCFSNPGESFDISVKSEDNNYVSLSFTPYEDNYFLIFAQDVTHLNHLETMRQDFVANVSHELRTPLTVVHGYLETLLNINKNKKWEIPLENMYQQTVRMQNLIEDLLLLSKLEAYRPNNKDFKLINIKSLLESIYQDAKTLSGKKNHKISLSMDETFTIYGIEEELRSVFSNLIFNAVHYTPAKGEIHINWFKENSLACFGVKDTGVGIAKKHIPRITERFYRVDRARSRESGGTGLGLAIVKHVLIHHHAKLKISSKINQGSNFVCLFPKELTEPVS